MSSSDTTYRKHMELPPDEVAPGDAVRDHGQFRIVDHIEPQVIEKSIVIHFADKDGPLSVPFEQNVSLWRVSR